MIKLTVRDSRRRGGKEEVEERWHDTFPVGPLQDKRGKMMGLSK